ncbi:related to syp1 ycr030c [Lichtheimia corymbifera JMRC:FSU:9682]|uniref:Related to syp1 ycr030c n=1 Tax=Lichtheimia corymbifera JMRC:FSU:9682 TaxID=1263082 RepID=A0A068S2F2_9FUNG|nr:related to syp1 ycr030c [Lichtheimia corymbifera JMRC:FSU:9682]
MTADQTNATDISNAYVDAFLTDRPKDGIDQVQTRLRKALKLNEELAEYFKERAHAEDLYAKTLAKISKKHFVSDPTALGNMRPIWEMLQNELTEVYTIHAVMSMKIIEDVEASLRSSIQNNNEYNTIKTMDGSLQRVARDYDERMARLNKSKGKKSSDADARTQEMVKAVEEVKAHWIQNGADYIQKHQSVDASRWDSLRTAIQKFEVLQNDQMLKRVEVANNVLTAASNFNVDDEILSFCATNKMASTTLPRSEQSMLSIDSATPSESLSVPQDNNGHPSLGGPTPVPSVSEQSHRSTGATSAKSTGGKSIGAKSTASKSGAGKKAGKDRKFFSGLMSIRRKTRATDNNGYVNADLSPPVMQHHDQHSSSSFGMVDTASSISNGFSSEREDHHTPNQDESVSPAPTSPTSLGTASIKKAPSFSGSLASNQPPKVLIDAEGYTIPPPDRAAWPGDTSLIDDDFGSDSGSMLSAQQRLKVDIKTEAKEEDAAQSAVALTRVSSMLKEKSTTTSGRRRGRRENRATRLLDPVQEAKVPVTLTDGPVQLTDGGGPITLTDNNNSPIIQSQSPFDDVTTTTTAVSPPDVQVRMNETIHALLRGGQLDRAAVIGEIKVVYHGPEKVQQPVYLHIDGLDAMEQVTPNTSYLTSVEGETGVYQLDTSMFHLAGDSPVTCIKYQLPVDEKALPIWARPMWKCEDEQTRLLVKYRKTSDNISEKDVHGVFFMTTVSGDVQNVQSIPAGQWVVEQERMVWPMGEWQDLEEHMLRAKFITKQQGGPQPIAIRFEGKDWLVSNVTMASSSSQQKERVDGGLWANIQSIERSVRTGKYIAEA